MDLKKYRENQSEQKRAKDLMRLISGISKKGKNVLDIGARDGYFSFLLTKFYENVIALDMKNLGFLHENIDCVQGDITSLSFSDKSFGLVFCAEVLEHIPPHLLQKACDELSRVATDYLLIGVPYKQDIRVGRTICSSCHKMNPPWGHVNSFNSDSLERLFPSFNAIEISFVGEAVAHTNIMSTYLMDLAGNPYGTYDQEEVCIHCGNTLTKPPDRTLLQKLFTKAAFFVIAAQKPFFKPHPIWIHMLYERKMATHQQGLATPPGHSANWGYRALA